MKRRLDQLAEEVLASGQMRQRWHQNLADKLYRLMASFTLPDRRKKQIAIDFPDRRQRPDPRGSGVPDHRDVVNGSSV